MSVDQRAISTPRLSAIQRQPGAAGPVVQPRGRVHRVVPSKVALGSRSTLPRRALGADSALQTWGRDGVKSAGSARSDSVQRQVEDTSSSELQEQINKIIEGLKERFEESKHHGYWCGPGSQKDVDSAKDCQTAKDITVDEVDVCCCVHDKEYEEAGISAESMWSEEGLLKGRPADEKFVACLASATTENEAYRIAAMILFQARVTIAMLLQAKDEFVAGIKGRIRQFKSDMDEVRQTFDRLLSNDAATWWWFIRRLSQG